MQIQRDVIHNLAGSWGSGLAVLEFQSGQAVHCENGATVRALDGATGGQAIGPGHTINRDGIYGLDMVYWTDWMGILEGFILYEDWLAEGYEPLEPGVSYELNTETGQVEGLCE